MVNVVKAENEDSFKSAVVENPEPNVFNMSLTHFNDTNFINKTKKFMVNLKPIDKTPFVLPKRGEKKPFVPKFQLKQKNQNENIEISTISTTNRPQVMQTKKFTSKPHTVDRTEEVVERYNVYNKRTPSKFNRFGTEENLKDAEGKVIENNESRFQNFTNIEQSINDNSDESKEVKRPVRRRFMKASESRKVKVVTSPPLTSTSTQKNYKIKDLLKNEKYIPRVERRKMPVLTLENDDDNNTRKNGVAPVVVDHKKSAFIRRKATTANPDEDKMEVPETVDESKSRQER